MITKGDIILLLTELQKTGINVDAELTNVLRSQNIPVSALKLINENKTMDIVNFYEKLRNSYNNKKSKLYINIMKADENALKDPKTVLTTLSALLNQILQFDAEDKAMFLKHSRASEISDVIKLYVNTYNIEPALKLLQLHKADVKVLQLLK